MYRAPLKGIYISYTSLIILNETSTCNLSFFTTATWLFLTIDLPFDWFANENKKCQLSYNWFQTGGQWYSDTPPFSIPWIYILHLWKASRESLSCRLETFLNFPLFFLHFSTPTPLSAFSSFHLSLKFSRYFPTISQFFPLISPSIYSLWDIQTYCVLNFWNEKAIDKIPTIYLPFSQLFSDFSH